MTDSLAPRRAMCANCLRPQSTCICGWVTRVDSELEVLVLMHPMEVANAKNSGRLLHLCLPNSALVVGEAFDAATLESLLFAGARQPVLLYPAGEGAPALPGLDVGVPTRREDLRLVALDATWRKSRKMLHLNPLLAGLPRLALDDAPASAYHIRKAHAPHQLSTLEAVAHALAQLEGARICEPLLGSFDAFVAHQAALARRA